MRIAQLVTGLLALVFGTPEAAGAEEDGRARYYSGAEWVLDADGQLLGSSAVLVERLLDIPNRTLRTNVLRESPQDGILPARSTTRLSLVATTASPFELDGLGERGDARVDVSERAQRNVLVIRETVRAEDGHAVSVHILDATALSRAEYEPWAARLAASH
jgi:hypothetical protein